MRDLELRASWETKKRRIPRLSKVSIPSKEEIIIMFQATIIETSTSNKSREIIIDIFMNLMNFYMLIF